MPIQHAPMLATCLSLIALTLTLQLTMKEARSEIQLKSGDRIVFLGDSITQAGARPGGYVSLVREAIDTQTDLDVEIIGAGISGHKVPDCQARLQRDVLDKNPTVVVIYIGINDVWHSTRDNGTPRDKYETGLKEMIARIQKEDARVVLCTPSVIGEKTDGSNTLDGLLEEYCQISREVARATDVELLDLRKMFIDRLKEINPENDAHSVLTTDGVHLNEAGNQFVSQCVLGAFGLNTANEQSGLLRHLVLFKFKDGTSEEKIAEIVAAFAALPEKIDVIHDFEMGTDVSVEQLSQGFTHGFMVTFRNQADLEAYLPHPAHGEFVELIGGHIDKVLVFDYWNGKEE